MTQILTKFSKGIKNSAALSFSLSASNNCDDSCRQKIGTCYALGPESRYKDYGKKLRKHGRTKQHTLIYGALQELKRKRELPTWFRFSVSGSFKAKSQMSLQDWNNFKKAMKEFCEFATDKKMNLHIPCETMGKARSLRSIVGKHVIRRSIQSSKLSVLINSKDHCSWVVPTNQNPQEIAQTLRDNGKTTVICPAVIGNSKCGKCLACASHKVDMVLYPQHK